MTHHGRFPPHQGSYGAKTGAKPSPTHLVTYATARWAFGTWRRLGDQSMPSSVLSNLRWHSIARHYRRGKPFPAELPMIENSM